jgi:Uma2 family endonuclease
MGGNVVDEDGILSTFLTPEQYLEIERQDEWKNEYLNGEMFAMPRVGEAHCLMVTNLIGELRLQLRPTLCRIYASRMRVCVKSHGFYAYPDVVVVCGESRFLDDEKETLLNPDVIIEVVSPASEAYDRGRKFEMYQALESLREYVLVASDRVHVDLYVRQPDDRWMLTSADTMQDSLTLESVNAQLKLSGLYQNIELAG